MIAIRMTRHGAKKRPFFHIVVADSRSPRDGRFIEKLGTYNPLLPRDHAQRLTLDKERIAHWLKVGAQPSDRVAKFLSQAELMKPRERREQGAGAHEVRGCGCGCGGCRARAGGCGHLIGKVLR